MSLAILSHSPIQLLNQGDNFTIPIYIILSMDYKHPYYRRQFLKNKSVHTITHQQPIVVVALHGQFLHFTLSQLLRINSLPHHLKTVEKNHLDSHGCIMIHRLPILVFEDEVIQQAQVSDFLCDLCLGGNQYADFIARKFEIKNLVRFWLKIFEFENMKKQDDFAVLQDLGVKSLKDYQNIIMEQLLNLSVKFLKRGLEQSYAGYSQNDPNPENAIFVDIITSILKCCPESIPDFYLRAHFSELIDHATKMKNRIENKNPLELMKDHEVVLERKRRPDDPEYAKWNLNRNKFMIAFGVIGGLYAWFIKQ